MDKKKDIDLRELQIKDLCLTCEHYWEDFPTPLVRIISHCVKVDEKYGFKSMDEYVPYPCVECPFNCYSPKK